MEWEPLVTLIATPDVRKLPRGVRDDKPHAPPLEKADLPPDLLARRPVAWTGGRRIELTTLDIVVTVVVLAVGVRALLTLIPSALPGKESSAAG